MVFVCLFMLELVGLKKKRSKTMFEITLPFSPVSKANMSSNKPVVYELSSHFLSRHSMFKFFTQYGLYYKEINWVE